MHFLLLYNVAQSLPLTTGPFLWDPPFSLGSYICLCSEAETHAEKNPVSPRNWLELHGLPYHFCHTLSWNLEAWVCRGKFPTNLYGAFGSPNVPPLFPRWNIRWHRKRGAGAMLAKVSTCKLVNIPWVQASSVGNSVCNVSQFEVFKVFEGGVRGVPKDT